MPVSKRLKVVWVILVLFQGLSAQRDTLFVLTNLQGAMADCHCGEGPSGSFARFYSFYQTYSEGKFILAGDFLPTYSYPEYVELIIQILKLVPFTLIIPGEQDFIHDAFRDSLLDKNVPLLMPAGMRERESPARIRGNFGIWKVYSVIGPLEPWYLEELPAIKCINPDQPFPLEVDEEHVSIPICVFHGYWKDAIRFYQNNPGFRGIIVSHDQLVCMEYAPDSSRFVASFGKEGELLGQIVIKHTGAGKFSFTLDTIPLAQQYPEHSEVLYRYNVFRQKRRQ